MRSEHLECRHVRQNSDCFVGYASVEGPADTDGIAKFVGCKVCILCRAAIIQALKLEPICARPKKDQENVRAG